MPSPLFRITRYPAIRPSFIPSSPPPLQYLELSKWGFEKACYLDTPREADHSRHWLQRWLELALILLASVAMVGQGSHTRILLNY